MFVCEQKPHIMESDDAPSILVQDKLPNIYLPNVLVRPSGSKSEPFEVQTESVSLSVSSRSALDKSLFEAGTEQVP